MKDAVKLRMTLGLLVGLALWSCGDGSDGDTGLGITDPTAETGHGRIYRIRTVAFPSIDGVPVSALFGALDRDRSDAEEEEPRPVVILVHDLALDNQQWFNTPIFLELLERGYLTLAIDLRGHGNTPFPDGRQAPAPGDLDNMLLDVRAALTWLKDQPEADAARVAVVGSGVGGNVAYVSIGAFPLEIKTAVALSPGIFDANLQPLVVGAGLEMFGPHTMLFMAGSDDSFQVQQQTVSFAAFADAMSRATRDPKRLFVLPGSSAHGVNLLADDRAAESFFSWLEERLT